MHFNLTSQEVGVDEIAQWLGPQPNSRPWYQRLTSAEPAASTFLKDVRASGTVSVNRLRIHGLVAKQVSANLELDRGKMKIAGLQADIAGGLARSNWQADFVAAPAMYTGSGILSAVSLAEIAAPQHDSWIAGTANATYQFTASGTDSPAFWQSADGELQFDVRDGTLPHILLTGENAPLRIARWQGHARLHAGKIEIDKGKLISPTATYDISGTASLGRALNIKLAQDSESKVVGAGALVYSITGTVTEPHVALTPATETQARLKP